MRKPVIGVGGVRETPPPTTAFPTLKRVFTNEGHLSKLQKAGTAAILIPLTSDQQALAQLVTLCDGILIPGGPDIDPSFYLEDRHELCGPSDLELDRFQLALFHESRRQNKPILGICRGTQLINVAQGGTLHQDFRLQSPQPLVHPDYGRWDKASHQVHLQAVSKLAGIFSATTIGVNSLHHQSVAQVGKDCTVAARSEDSSIEAIELTSGAWCIGVQWHPEAMGSEMDCLFEAFVEQARQ